MSDENTDVEARARDMGWSPRDSWRGKAEDWIDAETFVKRGTEILPILRAKSRGSSDECPNVFQAFSAIK